MTLLSVPTVALKSSRRNRKSWVYSVYNPVEQLTTNQNQKLKMHEQVALLYNSLNYFKMHGYVLLIC